MVNPENAIRWFQKYVDEFVELTTTDEYNHRMLDGVLEFMKSQKDALEQMRLDNQDLRQCNSEMRAEIERLKAQPNDGWIEKCDRRTAQLVSR